MKRRWKQVTLATCVARSLPENGFPRLVEMPAPHWIDSCNSGNADMLERTVHSLDYSLKTSPQNWPSLNYPDGKKLKER